MCEAATPSRTVRMDRRGGARRRPRCETYKERHGDNLRDDNDGHESRPFIGNTAARAVFLTQISCRAPTTRSRCPVVRG